MSSKLDAPAGPIERGTRDPALSQRHPCARKPRVVSVQRGYELWASSYDQEPNPLLALEERLLTPLLPNVKGKRILDLGCGTGRWLNKLLLRGARSGIGIDASPAMIAAARRKPLLQERLVRADILALPLASAVADLVICSFVIGHFPEIGPLAAAVARVARPRAMIYVSDVHPEASRRGWRTGFRSKDEAAEIATWRHSLAKVCEAFSARGLELTARTESPLGEPEKPIFERAGCLERFYRCSGWPAVHISRFRKLDSAEHDRVQ